MSRIRKLGVALTLLVLLLEGAWRLAVLSSASLPYTQAVERLVRLTHMHPAPVLAWRTLADRSWQYVQQERSLASIEVAWSASRDTWLQTGRDQDLARAAWLAVMLQSPIPGESS